MKKTLPFLFVVSLVGSYSFAQQEKFDLVSYTAPKDWKKQTTEQTIQWSQEDTKGAFCIIMIFKALPGSADAKGNFDAAWDAVVKEMVKINDKPEMQPASTENGWEAQSGYAQFEAEGQKGIALLVTSTGFGKMVNILVLTNADVYQNEMTAFFESVSIAKPAGGTANTGGIEKTDTRTDPASVKDGYTHSTTNFDNGWVSTIHRDYILVTKNNIQVYLSYIEAFNESNYSGTGLQKRHHYWDTYVAKYFETGQKKFDNGGALSDFSPDFIEGWATDKQTGEKRYIGMIINIFAYSGRLSTIIASAPDEQQFRRQFPKADAKFDNDLLPMYSYNKFAIGKNDLVGKWSSSGGGTMSWYSTTTGENVGATGAVKGDEFHFINSSSYTSSHSGATGWVGSMNTYQQKYKGSYSVTDWTLNVTNRWDGKPEKFDAWFEVVRGGRILQLRKTGMDYTLGKVN